MTTHAPRAITAAALIAAAIAAPAAVAAVPEHPAILQWFETPWRTIEYRMPDFFIGGYGATWIPHPGKARDPDSAGYDPLDRFNLGSPGDETAYGTDADFRAMLDQFRRANGLVYVEAILNHSGGRDGSASFNIEGGWPGFYTPQQGLGPGDDWGDYHSGTGSAFLQSENPGAPNYNLFDGDLVALQDFNQDINNWMVRHPADDSLPEGVQSSPSDPWTRIPEGTLRNKPNPANRALYPDTDLPAEEVFNPGFFRSNRNPGDGTFGSYNTPPQTVFFHPFNTEDPMAGDPVPENPSGILARWLRWMLEVYEVDGFRFDAIKHVEPDYWDRDVDPSLFNRWRKPDGTLGTPFSFGEPVIGNEDIEHYYNRIDGFGNRDALDLQGAGAIRGVIGGAKSNGFVASIDDGHIDSTDDGFNNGTRGVNHIYSHDNGSTGGGNAAPDFPFEDRIAPWAHAYLFLRPGPPKIYYNSRSFHSTRGGGFWPREGTQIALGYGSYYSLPGSVLQTVEDDRFTTLAQIRNMVGRGDYYPRTNDGQAFVFERQANLLVGLSDAYVVGPFNRTVTTFFPPGTRLHELTGNAADPEADPNGVIPEVITVGAGGSVTISVPGNGDSSNEHNKGYVAYAPAIPSGTLTITDQAGVIPPDSATTPNAAGGRRLATIPILQGPSFQLQLQTTQTDPLDPNTDDAAFFRINEGYIDFNDNGSINEPGAGRFEAYEGFLDLNSPLFTGGTGQYRQTIDTQDLEEGFNYISVVAFRHRPTGDPLFREWREVVYRDLEDAQVEIDLDLSCLTGNGSIIVTNPDRTATRIHVFVGLEPQDPLPPLNFGNRASFRERAAWDFDVSNLRGEQNITIVALEAPGGPVIRQVRHDFTVFADTVPGDLDANGVVNAEDLYAFEAATDYICNADVDTDDDNDSDDRTLIRDLAGAQELTDILANR